MSKTAALYLTFFYRQIASRRNEAFTFLASTDNLVITSRKRTEANAQRRKWDHILFFSFPGSIVVVPFWKRKRKSSTTSQVPPPPTAVSMIYAQQGAREGRRRERAADSERRSVCQPGGPSFLASSCKARSRAAITRKMPRRRRRSKKGPPENTGSKDQRGVQAKIARKVKVRAAKARIALLP